MKKLVFFVIAAVVSVSAFAACPKYSPYNCKIVGYKSNGEPIQQCGCGY